MAEAGLLISLAYGRCSKQGIAWTVLVLNKLGDQFERPFLCNDIDHGIEIAETESKRRGWL